MQLRHYSRLSSASIFLKGLAECISVCSQAHLLCLPCFSNTQTELALLLALRLGWLTLVGSAVASLFENQTEAVTELKQLAVRVCDSQPNLVEQALRGMI